MTKQISIIGCGWLGLPLAMHFLQHDYHIKGSTTSQEKLHHLKTLEIDPFYIEISNEGISGNIVECLSDSDILVLNIPPGIRKHPETDYVKQISYLIPYIEKSTIAHLIFISSTSVYSDEESIPTITEETVPNPDSESAKQLLKVENMLKKNKNFSTTILRFSGLFGNDRHPAKHLSGKNNLKNPEAPVNLIHVKDCIGIIHEIIKQNAWNEIFNVASIPHPTRNNYYTLICNTMNLAIPHFDFSIPSKGKLIDSTKLVQLFNYHFREKIE